MNIFHQIIEGKIPCHKIYEDRFCLAILDRYPLSKGHTLLLPKERATTLDQLSEASSAALGRILPALCRALLKSTEAHSYHVLQNNGTLANQTIAQVHFHIIPKYQDTKDLLSWNPHALEDAKGIQMAYQIQEALKQEPCPQEEC